jgi:hypothetical protein
MSLKKTLLVLLSFFFIVSVTGCEQEGTAEKAGKEVDKAFNTAKDKIHDATK